MNNLYDNYFINFIIVFITSLLILLTISEVLSPFFNLYISIVVTNYINTTPFFNNHLNSLYFSLIFFILINIFIIFLLYLQWKNVFKKKIHFFRIIGNILFIFGSILIFIYINISYEEDFKTEIINKWENSLDARDFELKYHCSGLIYLNKTNNQFCDSFINENLIKIFIFGRNLKTFIILFLISITFYSIIGSILVIYSRNL